MKCKVCGSTNFQHRWGNLFSCKGEWCGVWVEMEQEIILTEPSYFNESWSVDICKRIPNELWEIQRVERQNEKDAWLYYDQLNAYYGKGEYAT